eukprot:5457985-Prymnesium_polylepis.2
MADRAADANLHLNLDLNDFYLTDTQQSLRNAARAKKLDNLKLVLLQRDRKIVKQLALQSDYKRIVMLASSRQIVHGQAWSQPERHYCIAALEKAIEGKYKAKGYDVEDYTRTPSLHSSWAVSEHSPGSKLLFAQNKSRGLPSRGELMRQEIFKMPRLVMASGWLPVYIVRVVRENLERFVFSSSPPEKRCLWSIMLDDVNVDRR